MDRWATIAAMLGALLLGTGCGGPLLHPCGDDSQCEQEGRTGVCAQGGYCAFEDPACPSGWAYSEQAGAGLANACVPEEPATGSDAGNEATSWILTTGIDPFGSSSVSSSETGSLTSSTGASCPLGAACTPDDACAVGGMCDAAGQCVPTQMLPCDYPGACRLGPGECNGGVCNYPPAPNGDACDDGDPCTVGDACDGAGACVAGDVCPSLNPCEVGSCGANGCTFTALADGASCGSTASLRCCAGTCVDISSDTAHCGGCNYACAPGRACESIAVTTSCDSSAPATSGRCRCQNANAECPGSQICRTYTPYDNRCTPPDEDACAGTWVPQDLCPGHCGY